MPVTAELHTPSSGFHRHPDRAARRRGPDRADPSAVNRSGAVREITYGEHPCLSRPAFAGGRLDIAVRAATVLPPAQPAAASVAAGLGGALAPRRRPAPERGNPTARSTWARCPCGPTARTTTSAWTSPTARIAISAPGLGRVLRITVDPGELGHVLLWRHHQPRGPALGRGRVRPRAVVVAGPGLAGRSWLPGRSASSRRTRRSRSPCAGPVGHLTRVAPPAGQHRVGWDVRRRALEPHSAADRGSRGPRSRQARRGSVERSGMGSGHRPVAVAADQFAGGDLHAHRWEAAVDLAQVVDAPCRRSARKACGMPPARCPENTRPSSRRAG